MLKDRDIKLLKEQLLKRKEELLKQVNSSKTIIKELLSEATYDDMDYAEVSSDSYNLNLVREKQIQELNEIDVALKKIQDGTYGACDMCDEPIAIGRLKAKPFAKFCTDCREIHESNNH